MTKVATSVDTKFLVSLETKHSAEFFGLVRIIMNLKKYIGADAIVTELKSETKDEILLELLEAMCNSGRLNFNRLDESMAAILKREGKMSTGIQDGIAIPHARISGIKDIIAVLGTKPSGIDFNSLDAKPARIFIMTLSPVELPVPHVQFLAELMQKLKHKSVRDGIAAAASPKEVLALLFAE